MISLDHLWKQSMLSAMGFQVVAKRRSTTLWIILLMIAISTTFRIQNVLGGLKEN